MCGLEIYIAKEDIKSHDNCKHRGPDSTKKIDIKYFDYQIRLVFHRLSIIDLENGEQPFIYENDDETIYLLCNGEIYNYKKLIEKYMLKTNSDCKVIIEMYKKSKNIYNIIQELDGEFAFVLLVLKKSYQNISIFYGRDRFGIRPLFHKFEENKLFISSELKGIPNMDGKQVEPRKIYWSNLNNVSVNTYYYIGTNINKLNNIKDSLIESVRDRMQTERPLGALLSGGLDSSLICGIASNILKETNKQLTTFTIGMDADSPDIEYARKVAKHINSIHQLSNYQELLMKEKSEPQLPHLKMVYYMLHQIFLECQCI
jgi:asparagine synthase (glutamine-hydrolysing)